jgi:hypothetical protein
MKTVKMNRKWWTGGMAISVTELKDLQRLFLWGFMKFRVCGNGKRKQRQQLMISVMEAAASTANAMVHTFRGATPGGMHGLTRWSLINSGLIVNVLNS